MQKKNDVNQRHCLEERGQWLENVDSTHLVLASGKPVLQKMFHRTKSFFLTVIANLLFRRHDGQSRDAPELRRRRSLPRFPEAGMFRLRREHEGHLPPDQHAGRERRQGLLRRLHPGQAPVIIYLCIAQW